MKTGLKNRRTVRRALLGNSAAALLVSGAVLLASPALAQEKTANDLLAGKTRADMTYRQLMQIMGGAVSTITRGIVFENKQMVQEGVNFITGHPAPNHKPWTIVAPEDQEEFKATLVAFDGQLDLYAKAVADAARQGDWFAANAAASELSGACISCHSVWRAKVR